MTNWRKQPQRAFALLLTLSLLALLVVVLLALSALLKVDTQLAITTGYQVQARQNALLGMHQALAQLQSVAAPDRAITGTADIVPGTKPANARWTGVWPENSTTPTWLVSGNENPAVYAPGFQFGPEITNQGRKILPQSTSDIVLVGNGSTNTSTTADRYFDGDAVIVPKVGIPAHTAAGASFVSGDYAYWVGDEGVKLSAALPGENAPPAPAPTRHAIAEIPGGWTPSPGKATKALSYEHLTLNAGAGEVSIKSTFHGATLLHLGHLDYPARRAGLININSIGTRLWRGLLGTYSPDKTAAAKRNFASAIGQPVIWGPAGADKIANGPFTTVAGFLDFNSEVGVVIADVSAELDGFKNAWRPWFTVRSDTFRIRAYGDALNPVPEPGQPAGKVEAVAYCEAIVQRVKSSASPADGRFVITYFRWLAPDDI
jgi:hypothetical protein